jgi:phage terminase large subunit-like protein
VPKGDKEMRMAAVSPIIQEGRAFLPEFASWR